MAILGRKSARQRRRRATRESLTIPVFNSPLDCTPWVIGGLWPAELSTISDETATVTEHLKVDLERIASCANDELRTIRRAGINDPSRQATEAEVIDQARARAVRRIESSLRQSRGGTQAKPTESPRPLDTTATESAMQPREVSAVEDR